jgi:hypothetical protein
MNTTTEPTGLTVTGVIHFDRRGKGGHKGIRTEPVLAVDRGRVPRVARLLALALRFDTMLRKGVVTDCSELASLGHVTHARISQIMSLINLAPDIQEAILFLPRVERGRDTIILRDILPIAMLEDWRKQRKWWNGLVARCKGEPI